ncbi:hypothetical protein KUH03_11485 [Sphingobacterium sp. E70]|uniref:hypothetical protein n=1 Tax=Sphingobacterium sp. E70 TaxID=2853439 RepID=UPI00211C1A59|nr:hypothetical protein [Sphingobacterium sp. E70]ULT27321.1 hypothetical protein KUH03_11485 [Sphingobacterium sp. E70]
MTASSTAQDTKVNYAASNITDGSLESRWMASDTIATVDIQLDSKKNLTKSASLNIRTPKI